MTYFRGSELQNYFTRVLEDHLKPIIKPQYVDQIPKAVKGIVEDHLNRKNELKNKEEMIDILGMSWYYIVHLEMFLMIITLNQI